MRKVLPLLLAALLLCFTGSPAVAERAGYLSILLIGQDEPGANATYGYAAAIVIATLNLSNGSTRLLSVDPAYRTASDGTVLLGNAHTEGGPHAVLGQVNLLFGLSIDRYALVGKDDMAEIVGALGDIEIDVREQDLAPTFLSHAGPQRLDREQATRYMTVGDAASRAERQRAVLAAIMSEVFSRGFDGMLTFAKAVLPLMKTNMPITEIMNAAAAVLLQGLSAPLQDRSPSPDAPFTRADDGGLDGTDAAVTAERQRVDGFLYPQ